VLIDSINRSRSLLEKVGDALICVEELSFTPTGFTLKIDRNL